MPFNQPMYWIPPAFLTVPARALSRGSQGGQQHLQARVNAARRPAGKYPWHPDITTDGQQ